jgi:alpha-glucosidase
MKFIYFTTFLLHIYILQTFAQQQQVQVTSPDKSIIFRLSIKEGRPYYTVQLNNRIAIDSSTIGLIINHKEIKNGITLNVIQRRSVNASYKTRGVHCKAIDKYNEMMVAISGVSTYSLEIRVFNDGVAYRCTVPNSGDAVINDDLSTFKIPAGSTIWNQLNIYTYEGEYKKQSIEEIQAGQIAGPPITIKLPANRGYAAISEAGLTNFAGMSLQAEGNRLFKANLTGSPKLNGKIVTPWRVILLGSTLNTLVSSDIISNVSPKPKPELFPNGFDTDWIKPGKSVWSWLADNGKVTLENMKRFTDWAAELGIDYNLVDEGWSDWKSDGKGSWDMMKELVDYSAKKGVKIWAWKAYPDRKGVPGIKDSVSRNTFFKKCNEIGIAGLKIDFFDVENQEVIQYYQSALRDAAKYKLMINFHGSNKPTGESRTWPNEMSREGVMGLENWSHWPTHNTTLPFTRFLAGHADYTPLTFSQDGGTTLTHQLASVAAFTSPFMCLGVNPEKLIKSNIKNMVKDLPVVWGKTIILPQSQIGELVVMARRSGSVWYLIVLNGEISKELEIDPSFLTNGNYQLNCFTDNEDNRGKTIEQTIKYSTNIPIKMKLQKGGGWIGTSKKIK